MVGEELRKAREAAGMTQEGLAFEAGLSRPYVSILERDLKSPTLHALFRICAALGIKASVLVARVERAQARLAEVPHEPGAVIPRPEPRKRGGPPKRGGR